MKNIFGILGIITAVLLYSRFVPHQATLTELPLLTNSDAACGATQINDKGQVIGWSGEPG
jgi:hypothetical protein